MIIVSDKCSTIDHKIGSVFGVCEAFIIANIDKWLTVYQDNREKYEIDHYREGRWWVYNTVDTLTEEIEIFSKRQIQCALKNLKEQNVVVICHFSKGYNRTNWYTIDYDNLLMVLNKADSKITGYKKHKNTAIDNNKSEPINSNKTTLKDSDKSEVTDSNKIVPIRNHKTATLRDAELSLSYITTKSTTISLIYINDPSEKEKVCEMFDRTIKNNLIANYPIHTNLTLVEIMIRNRVSECHSFDEAEQLLGAIWHGVNLYKSEYESKHRDEDGNVDYQFLPNLKKVYTTELMDDETYYFREGLKRHRQFMLDRYGKVYGGETNAG